MSPAIAYCRISKDDQGTALGVERQEKLCRKLAAERALDLVEVLVDNDVSAYRAKTKRPAFERLVAMLDDGSAGAVVTYHTDRLYRRTTDLERLVHVIEATKVQVHTVAAGNVDLTNASGRMVARMLGAAAQGESERMGERIKAKHDELAAAGKPPGGRPPFGYAASYKVNAAEAAAVRYMADRVLEGGSLLRIARELDERGVTTREGRPWHHSSVRATLVNPAIAGLRVHRREVAGPGLWEPILDRATWEQVKAVLADPSRKRTKPPRRYLLGGMVESPAGDPMTGRPDRAGGDEARRTYSTRSPAKQGMTVGADVLEEVVVEMVLQLLDDEVLDAPAMEPDAGADVARVEQELAELAALRGAGDISLAEWMAARKPLQERLAAAKAGARTTRRPAALDRLLSEPGAARKAWGRDELSLATKRDIVRAVVEKIVVGPATRGRWTSIEERLDPDRGWGVHFRG
jgi:site-specific DNA recombinase